MSAPKKKPRRPHPWRKWNHRPADPKEIAAWLKFYEQSKAK